MTQTGVTFTRPYAKELLGAEKPDVGYIYPRQELISEPIFPYFVLDGGAFNLAADRFMSMHDMRGRFGEVNGDILLDKIMSGELFGEFIHGGKYNWERSFAYTKDFTPEFTPKYEWQIWPQRLYMILPLAQAFLRSGDDKYSSLWLETFRGWTEAHPYQEYDASISYIRTDMVWRDMQVAWRTLSLLHSIFMLQDAPFTKEDWAFIYDQIKLHAQHLFLEAKSHLDNPRVQNHVLQIGSALVMCAVMFPEFEFSSDMLQAGIKVVEMNMAGILADGGSDEDSPSYSHFIARLYLETLLILRNNSLPEPEGLNECVMSQYRWINRYTTPKGNVPRISDSYSIDSEADIARVNRFFPLDLKEKDTSAPCSAFAKIEKGELTLYIDALDPNGLFSHLHFGRPQTLLYYGKGEQSDVLIDAGCCNYDRWEFYRTVRSTEYHNVVYSPLINDDHRHLSCRIDEINADSVAFSCEVSGNELSYTWKRTITLADNGITIKDEAHSETELPWVSHLFFARRDSSFGGRHLMRQLCEDHVITAKSELPYQNKLMPVMNDQNRIDYAVVMENTASGKDYSNTIEITFEKHEY